MYDMSKTEQVKHEIAELIKKYTKDDVPPETIRKISSLTPEQTGNILYHIAELIEEYTDK